MAPVETFVESIFSVLDFFEATGGGAIFGRYFWFPEFWADTGRGIGPAQTCVRRESLPCKSIRLKKHFRAESRWHMPWTSPIYLTP